MGNLYPPVDSAYLIDSLDLWRKSTVNTKHLSIDDCSERQVIEYFCAVFPGVGVAILAIDFIEESVHLGDLAAFMVASQKGDLVGILDFEAQ